MRFIGFTLATLLYICTTRVASAQINVDLGNGQSMILRPGPGDQRVPRMISSPDSGHQRVPRANADTSSTASASKRAVPRDTTADTGLVLLTPSDLARIDTIAQALQVTVVAHPELDKKKVDRADPYYIAKTPRLAAVIMQTGWTPMQYYHLFSSFTSAVEKCMFAIFGLPQGNSISDRNVRLVCGGVPSQALTGSDSSRKKE